jgi:hypothetical protein
VFQSWEMPWPHTCPSDLRRRLEGVLSFRSPGPAEIWSEIRDWLVQQDIEAPDEVGDETGLGTSSFGDG